VSGFRRKGGEAMLRGQAEYLDDIEFVGLLHCAILRSPHPHARIVRIDTRHAQAAPGVRAVLTGETARDLAAPMPHVFDPANVGGHTAEFRCLPVDRVRYVGAPVAAVAADTLRQAQAAVDLIDVEWEELPFVLDGDEALADDAPRVFDWPENVVGRYVWAEGDADAVIEAAPHVTDGEVRMQRYYCAPIETRGYVAAWMRGELTFHASSQMPHPLRSHLAVVLGMPENRIRVVAPTIGGGFGHKFHGFEEEIVVALLSKLAGGAPVKWLETRADSMLVGAREFTYRMTIAADGDGRILALRAQILGNVGALGPWGGWCMTFPAGMTLPGPYRIKDYHVETVPVVTNKAPWSGARGYGKEAAALALERLVDLVAEEVGIDPADVRRANFIPPDEFPYWTAGKRLDSGDYAGVLDEALELSSYASKREEQEAARRAGRLIGIGIGFELTPEGADFAGSFFRGYDTSTVRVDASGSVTVLTGVTSPGSGNDSGIAQIVAAELGIDVDTVKVVQGDTESCPFGFGNFSSRALTTGGGAAVRAAREVKQRTARVAATLLDVDVDELTFAEGAIRTRSGLGGSLAFSAVADQVYRRAVPIAGDPYPQLEATCSDGPGNYQWIPDEQGRMSMYPTFPYSCHVTVVEVDPDTGVVHVLEHVSVDDCGVVINHVLVESQLQGAAAMGIGGALWEHVPYDDDGRPLTQSFKDYLLPRAPDLPSIRVGSRETASPFTSLGTKGVGESGVGGTLASVTNAVNDALAPLGVRVHELPLSPPRLLKAMRVEASTR
jgi:aerobic carbon-monoxide dehydrogenase large subunit